MPWLRLWDDALDSPKVHRLKPDLFRAWIFLLLAAKRHNRDGVIPDMDTLAFWLRTSEDKIRAWIDELILVGMLEMQESLVCIHDWLRWQEPKDRTVAQRMRRYREEQKKKSPPGLPKEETEIRTEQSRPEDVTRSVTRTVTHRNVTPYHQRNGDGGGGGGDDGNVVSLRRNGHVTENSPEIERIANLAAELAGDISWSLWVSQQAKWHPPHAIEEALRVCVDKNEWSRPLAGGVLKRLAKQGYPIPEQREPMKPLEPPRKAVNLPGP